MKKYFKLLFLMVLGASLLTLNACKEETTDDPTPTPTINCYLTSFNDDGDLYTYTLDDDNTVLSVTNDGSTTNFTYDNDGRLTNATDADFDGVFVYSGANTLPDRININAQGQTFAYLKVTHSNGNITEVESHLIDQQLGDIAFTRNSYTYNGGDVVSTVVEEFDLQTQQFTEAGRVENITNDGKENPLKRSLAYFFMHFENPNAVGASNITGGDVTVDGNTGTLTIEYDYNENGYPTSALQVADGDSLTMTYGYDCK